MDCASRSVDRDNTLAIFEIATDPVVGAGFEPAVRGFRYSWLPAGPLVLRIAALGPFSSIALSGSVTGRFIQFAYPTIKGSGGIFTRSFNL
jgi:hypothetical protein